jgi:SAM-dependent methyltransferase
VADDSAAAQARFDDEGKGASNVVELDPLSGATAPFELVEDRDPTEPSLPIEPDPLGGDEPDPADLGDSVDLSDASIEVHFSDPPEHRPVATAIEMRQSEPPEELFLEDADVLSRSDIAPPLDQTEALIIPIPKPPPPPTESAESAPAAAQTPEDESWYERFFGEAYLRTVRTATPKEVAAECDFIERALRVPAGSRVLDVGCGLGAQTVDLASRGYQMVGLDISATMVSRAVDEAVDRGLQIEFMCGDMREVTFEEPFEALLCWGTTFGYFNEEENELAIRQFRRALKPNGTLLLDIINRDFMIGSQPNQVWFEVDTAVCMEETDFDYETSRLRVKRRVASHSGQQTDRRYSIRLYALHEIRALLERNGFRIDEVSGREATLGVFFGVHSPKMIIRAERLPGPFADEIDAPPPARTPPIPKGALKPSEFPSDRNDDP